MTSWSTTRTHTHPFNRPFSGTTRVSRYQKVKPIWNLLKQVTVSGSGISWDICKSAPRSSSLQTRCPFCRPTNSVKALKAKRDAHKRNLFPFFLPHDIHCSVVVVASILHLQRRGHLADIHSEVIYRQMSSAITYSTEYKTTTSDYCLYCICLLHTCHSPVDRTVS